MNSVDYFLDESKDMDKNFVLGRKEVLSYVDIREKVMGLSLWLKKEVGRGEKILLASNNSSFFIIPTWRL